VKIREPVEADWPLLPAEWQDGHVLVAELDGRPAAAVHDHVGHLEVEYLLPEAHGRGLEEAFVRELTASFLARGVERVTVAVDAHEDEALAAWRALGFVESRWELGSGIAALEERLGEKPAGVSAGSVHVQTDDQAGIARSLERFVPRLFRSRASAVTAPRNGWIGVHNDVASHEPDRLRRLAGELSHITGGVVLALGVEDDAVVRVVAFERGRMMDEYLSVPEHYGQLPPGDVVALRANPRVLARLTGGNMEAVRAIAKTAASPAELPPPPDHLAQLADALGIDGAGLSFDEVAGLEGTITVEHP
jgi:GNAT superfamily N-acetyltransferase